MSPLAAAASAVRVGIWAKTLGGRARWGQVIWDLTTHSRPTGSVTPARLQQVILPLVTVSQWPAILGLTHHQLYDLCRGLGASLCQVSTGTLSCPLHCPVALPPSTLTSPLLPSG